MVIADDKTLLNVIGNSLNNINVYKRVFEMIEVSFKLNETWQRRDTSIFMLFKVQIYGLQRYMYENLA